MPQARSTNTSSCIDDPLWSASLLLQTHVSKETGQEKGEAGGPKLIKSVHLAYLEAGADVIITSSYQASVEGFRQKGVSDLNHVRRLFQLTLQLAHEARQEFLSNEKWLTGGRERPLVAASIGPYGAVLHDGSEYRGDYCAQMSQAELIAFHLPRIEMLLSNPALAPDLFACETLPCLAEAQALVHLFEENYPDQRIWLLFTCKNGEQLSDGLKFSDAILSLQQSDVVMALGINCTPPQYISSLLETIHGKNKKPLVVYPNSGEGWDATTKQWTPSVSGTLPSGSLGLQVSEWFRLGATIVGGCCRTTPEDIRCIRQTLEVEQKS